MDIRDGIVEVSNTAELQVASREMAAGRVDEIHLAPGPYILPGGTVTGMAKPGARILSGRRPEHWVHDHDVCVSMMPPIPVRPRNARAFAGFRFEALER